MSAAAQPPITVSSLDLARLERLLDLPAYSDQDAAQRLGDELIRANILPPAQMPPDVVTMNSKVTFIEEISGKEHELTLVYPQSANAAENRVSVLAPIGTALLGLSIGQTIDWAAPDGRPLRVRVATIQYQPEAAGDLSL